MVVRCFFCATRRDVKTFSGGKGINVMRNVWKYNSTRKYNNSTVWMVWDGRSLAGQNVDWNNGGRLRVAADNRALPRAGCNKLKKLKIVPYHAVPSWGTIPEPYRTVPYFYRSWISSILQYKSSRSHVLSAIYNAIPIAYCILRKEDLQLVRYDEQGG
jgi:hypothetical protein